MLRDVVPGARSVIVTRFCTTALTVMTGALLGTGIGTGCRGTVSPKSLRIVFAVLGDF